MDDSSRIEYAEWCCAHCRADCEEEHYRHDHPRDYSIERRWRHRTQSSLELDAPQRERRETRSCGRIRHKHYNQLCKDDDCKYSATAFLFKSACLPSSRSRLFTLYRYAIRLTTHVNDWKEGDAMFWIYHGITAWPDCQGDVEGSRSAGRPCRITAHLQRTTPLSTEESFLIEDVLVLNLVSQVKRISRTPIVHSFLQEP